MIAEPHDDALDNDASRFMNSRVQAAGGRQTKGRVANIGIRDISDTGNREDNSRRRKIMEIEATLVRRGGMMSWAETIRSRDKRAGSVIA